MYLKCSVMEKIRILSAARGVGVLSLVTRDLQIMVDVFVSMGLG